MPHPASPSPASTTNAVGYTREWQLRRVRRVPPVAHRGDLAKGKLGDNGRAAPAPRRTRRGGGYPPADSASGSGRRRRNSGASPFKRQRLPLRRLLQWAPIFETSTCSSTPARGHSRPAGPSRTRHPSPSTRPGAGRCAVTPRRPRTNPFSLKGTPMRAAASACARRRSSRTPRAASRRGGSAGDAWEAAPHLSREGGSLRSELIARSSRSLVIRYWSFTRSAQKDPARDPRLRVLTIPNVVGGGVSVPITRQCGQQ